MKKQKTCTERIKKSWQSRKKDLAVLLEAKDYKTKELGSLFDYGLSIDLIEAGTFKNQRADFIRYLFSWGGPQDELRFYKNGDIEYWFLDWWDGALIDVSKDQIALKVWSYVNELVDFWQNL